jgi:hypothetical protein
LCYFSHFLVLLSFLFQLILHCGFGVTEFLEKLPKFKAAFPLYKNYKIHGALAGIEGEEQAARYAYKQGLFVIVQAGEMVKFANDDQFQPKSW